MAKSISPTTETTNDKLAKFFQDNFDEQQKKRSIKNFR